MNPIVSKLLMMVPWWKLAKWLLAESAYKLGVAEWVAAENKWYLDLAAKALGFDDTEKLKKELAKGERDGKA